jgi:glutathione synthase/RimK-type ligase-like ATP-grasp enzyme
MKLAIMPYNQNPEKLSRGARQLAAALNLPVVRITDGFRAAEPTTILNWGRGDFPRWRREASGWINNPRAVMNAIDKETALELMRDKGVPCVEFTRDIEQAKRWVREGNIVLCRLELQGREGSGIIVARREAEVVEAPLYTKYVRKLHEYRIHVMNGEVIYSNVKAKKRDVPANAEQLVRSGKNGWFLQHLDAVPNNAVADAAIKAVAALGLDFGGVDIGQSEDGTVRVYEVNSAPELGPNTTAAYKAAFQKHYGRHTNNNNVPIATT